MQVNVEISKAVLQWVVRSIQLDILPPDVRENLSKWLAGEKVPTFNQVEKASNATGIPLGYFFLQVPPEESIPLMEYRTVNSFSLDRPSRNLIDTIHDMEQIQNWAKEYIVSEGVQPPICVGFLGGDKNPISCAQIIRSHLNLPIDWFAKCSTADDSYRLIRKSISDAGVIVMMSGIVENNTHRVLNIEEFRAFAMIDEHAPLIFINTNDSANGRLFSLLHEFAHICAGQSDFFNDRQTHAGSVKPIETLCNAIAAEILVPQSLFLQEWSKAIEDNSPEEAITLLAKYFKCGTTVIARKALDNRKIEDSLYNKIATLAVKIYKDSRQKNRESGGNFYRTAASRIDRRFFQMLIRSVSEGRTLYSDAFRLTNTNRSTYAKLVEAQNGGV